MIRSSLRSEIIFVVFWSGLGLHYTTRTALVKVLNDIHIESDGSRPSALVLLNLSGAFKRVNLNRPEE